MELWIGAEFSGDIGEEIRSARNLVEDEINKKIKHKQYPIALDSWDCIAIIMRDEDFDEVVKYSKKKRDMDFRLKISYSEFQGADLLGRQRLFVSMLTRSLDLLEEYGLSKAGLDALRQDFMDVVKANEWINVNGSNLSIKLF